MLVIIENEYEGSDFEEILNFDYQKTAEDVVSRVLSDCSCPYDAEANILLTGLSEIEEINSEMRGIASPTDVLSFPMHEYTSSKDQKPGRRVRSQHYARIRLPHSSQRSSSDRI